MTAEELRRVRGGVIGTFTPKEILVDVAVDTTKGAVADNALGIKVPAGKFVYGAYIKNLANDLASTGEATLTVKVGEEAVLNGATLEEVKGKGKAILVAEPVITEAEQEVKLTVATAELTAGKLAIGIIYG